MLGLDAPTIISRIITLLIAFTAHEFSHAWMANFFGDDTAKLAGRLTLNPASHLDLVGTLMLLLAGFGWARPVPVNPYVLQRRSPAALMWVSLAGPLSNFLLAIVAAIPLRFGWVPLSAASTGFLPSVPEFLLDFLWINLTLMLFNLIPLAPLDGESIALYLLPFSWGKVLESIRPVSPVILIVVVFVAPRLGIDVFGLILTPVILSLARLLIGVGA